MRFLAPVLTLIIGVAVQFHGAATARETSIPRKLDEPAAERLAAEAVFGADKLLEYFDYDERLNRTFTPPFVSLRPQQAAGGRRLRLLCRQSVDRRRVGSVGLPQIVYARLAQIAGRNPAPFHRRGNEAICPAASPQTHMHCRGLTDAGDLSQVADISMAHPLHYEAVSGEQVARGVILGGSYLTSGANADVGAPHPPSSSLP